MPILKEKPTLQDLQEYVRAMAEERGFSKDDLLARCLLLGEEVGELFKAIRKEKKTTKIDHNSKFDSAQGELADIFIVLLSVANKLDIDLEEAFRQKEEINKKRTWQGSNIICYW